MKMMTLEVGLVVLQVSDLVAMATALEVGWWCRHELHD
jgi:hypothetical protein